MVEKIRSRKSGRDVLPNNVMVVPVDLAFTRDGALGAFATGMGSTDMAAIMAYGKAWLKVPRSYRIEVDGNLGAHVYSKNVFLHLRGRIAARVLAGQECGCGATRRVV